MEGNEEGNGGGTANHLGEELERDRFLVFRRWVVVFVATELPLKNERSLAILVERGVASTACDEGLAYTIDGGAACSCNQVIIAFCGFRPCFLSNLLSEGSEESMAVCTAEGVKEGVIGKFATVEEIDPPFPGAVGLIVSGGGDCVAPGSSCTQKSSMEVRAGGSGLMRKFGGICEGKEWKIWRVRRWSLRISSRERRSATSFSDPANHWP